MRVCSRFKDMLHKAEKATGLPNMMERGILSLKDDSPMGNYSWISTILQCTQSQLCVLDCKGDGSHTLRCQSLKI